jgi:hypothetical protein
MEWVPAQCTLPTQEQPLRVAEFDELFATALLSMERPDPGHLRLTLDGEAQVEQVARDLAARETSCCSFFSFAFSRGDAGLVMDVEVPAVQAGVLDGLAARAAASRSSQ